MQKGERGDVMENPILAKQQIFEKKNNKPDLTQLNELT